MSTPCETEIEPKVPILPGYSAEPQPELMGPEEARRYRRAAARVNYLAMDRPDIAVAANRLARTMARHNIGDERGVKRVIRYLAGSPRCVWRFDVQQSPECSMFTPIAIGPAAFSPGEAPAEA